MLARARNVTTLQAKLVATKYGWPDAGEVAINLGNLDTTIATVAYASGTHAVVKLATPLEPNFEMELALLGSPREVALTKVGSIENEVTWSSRYEKYESILIDEDAFECSAESVLASGLPFRVIPNGLISEELQAIAGEDTVLVTNGIDAPSNWQVAKKETGRSTFYGLIEKLPDSDPNFAPDRVAWLALKSLENEAGTLANILAIFSAQGIDLTHIRNAPAKSGHVFFVAFRTNHIDLSGTKLTDALREGRISYRIIGSFSFGETVPTEGHKVLVWSE